MLKTKVGLEDPTKEFMDQDPKSLTKETMFNRSRFSASIDEAYTESQASCKVQLGFYFAFALIVSQDKWKKANCIAGEALPNNKGIIFHFSN